MLRQLTIHDVVLIDRLELEFEPGLGALTGETGAGKSILLDSLGLALGLRADAGLVRAGQAAASVSAEIELPPGHSAFAALEEQGIDIEPGEPLLLRRTLKADGGSRAFAGGTSVPASLLRDIGSAAIEIHGQHDDRGLLNPRGHRALLDAYGKLETATVEAAWTRRSAIEMQLAEQRRSLAEADRDREWLDFAIAEIDALQVEAGEEERLAEARGQMKAAARIEDDLQ
ncbi:MAG: AAA family ATPase, partial [Pseudomonadota bacterium]